MAQFKMLLGLPGSGKTTYARSLLQSSGTWMHLSSDEITRRHRLSGESIVHQDTFEEMYRETVLHLENGMNVIYDATNLASKRRKSFLNRIEKFQPETEAIVFLTPYEVLKARNTRREGVERVPDHIVERYIRAFELPRKDEKFESILFLSKPPITGIDVAKLKKQAFTVEECQMFLQSFDETKAMTETAEMRAVMHRTYEMIEDIKKEVSDAGEQELLSWTILLHAIGKAYTRKNLPVEQDNFYGYEHASAYLAYQVLLSLQFPLHFIYDVLLLIDEHVIGKRSKRGKVKRRVGLDNYERLEILWRAIG